MDSKQLNKKDNVSTTCGGSVLEEEEDGEELDKYYFTTLEIDSYYNLVYNLKVDVYKNLPRPTDKELFRCYFTYTDDYYIKNNKFLIDARPLMHLLKNNFKQTISGGDIFLPVDYSGYF